MEQLKKMEELLDIPNDLIEYITNIEDIDLSSDTQAKVDHFIKTVYKDKDTLCKFVMVIDQYDRQHPTFVKVVELHSIAIRQSPSYAYTVNKFIVEDPKIQQQYRKLESIWNSYKNLKKRQVDILV